MTLAELPLVEIASNVSWLGKGTHLLGEDLFKR